MRTRSSERGEGKLSGIIWLAVFLAAAFAAWNVAPVYIDHYALKDKMTEVARAPRGTNPDQKLLEQLSRYLRENRLEGFVRTENFKISTLETGRRICVDYDRTATVLPGWERTFKFSDCVEQPLIY